MKQNFLNFKPCVSSGLADNPNSPIPLLNDGLDGESSNIAQTSPLSARDSIDLKKPPVKRKFHSSSTASKNPHHSFVVSSDDDYNDEDDDDVSDPPPLIPSPIKGRPKGLTKKRPSNGSVIAPAKKPKKDAASSEEGHPKAAAPSEARLCHLHRADCASEKLRCTWMRTPNARCRLIFCQAALKYQHGIDMIAIRVRDRLTPDEGGSQHCPASEASYLFKCPRCAGKCECKFCLRSWYLPPKKPSKPSSKASAKQGARATTPTKAKAAHVDKKGKLKSKAATEESPEGGKPAKGTQQGKQTIKNAFAGKFKPLQRAKTARQTSLPRPLKAPSPVAAPELEVIKTTLKPENIWARIWIYETLVRFDFIKIPKAILSTLDKFELWTHRQMQLLLERILVALAGISSIHNGQPKAQLSPAIEAYRTFGDDVKRGEPWRAAKLLAEASGCPVQPLPHVERYLVEESKEPAETPEVDRGPTLLGSRLTRTRRAAEVKALERVKAQSLANCAHDVSEDETSACEDEPGSDKGVWNHDTECSRQSEENENEGPHGPGRRSKRIARAQPTGATVEGSRCSIRQQAPPSKARTVKACLRGRSSSFLSNMTPSPRWDETQEADDVHATTSSPPPIHAASDHVKEEPIAAPDMEEKVAIICAILEIVLFTPEVAEELKEASARLPEIEKLARDKLKQTEKDWEEEKRVIMTSAPSVAKMEEFARWKKGKDKRERNHRLRVLDIKINAQRQTEANKLRTGPLGVDADGRTFWQLTEFNEQMPRDTVGRWAWCLLVFGPPMTKHAPPADVMPDKMPNISPVKPRMTEDEAIAGGGVARDVMARDDGKLDPVTPSKASGAEEESDMSDLTSISEQDGDEDVIMRTNFPPSFKDVIDFLRYRCAQRDYEELKGLQEAEIAQKVGEDGVGKGDGVGQSSGSPFESAATGGVNRKAKRQMKQAQEARKARVEALCKKLETLRWYYLWHVGEPDETIEV